MQENLTNSFYSHNDEEAISPKDFYIWAAAHTRLCQVYVAEYDVNLRKELDEKLESSLLQGKILLNSLNTQTTHKPLIPISGGVNRFTQPKELLSSKEMMNKNTHYPFRAELGTSCNLKSIPMPSRTYIKKKTPTQ